MQPTRRRFVRGAIACSVTALTAGCNNDEPDDEPPDDPDDPTSRIDSYLTENDANLYDGTIVDMTDVAEITIAVGAGEDGLAYDPPAAKISVDTTVIWEWTGRGGRHNVISESQIGSDFEFSSGDLIGDAGHTWSYTFEESGVAVYYCQAHRAVGHHGGLIIE